MFYSVDHIEGPLAVLQDDEGENRAVPLAELPEGLREGDVLCREGESWRPAPEERDRRRAELQALLDRLAGK